MCFDLNRCIVPLLLLLVWLGTSCTTNDSVSGIVVDEDGPVAGAIVRVQTTENGTTTDELGFFTLSDLNPAQPVKLTAWAAGYYIAGGDEYQPGDDDIKFVLVHHSSQDNPDYQWLPSKYHPGQGEGQGCAECHSSEGAELAFDLPVDEWQLDAHSLTLKNPRFITMYLGTDMSGDKSPSTRYGYSRDYGKFPLRPDPNQPYYGPGYKLDFPETAGNCAACHGPAAAIDAPYNTDPLKVSSESMQGVICDFCHKVWAVRLDSASGLPFANMPGVLSYEFRRPNEGHQFFAGPYDDVAPGEDTFSPLQTQSQFCAPCHFGLFWDTEIYNSFGEWLQSPYSDPQTGQTCQDCHMPPSGVTHFALREKGGLERQPETIFSHRMPGAADEELMQNAVSMTVDANRDHETIHVEVSITNDKTGHHVPTDSPLRHLILLVNVVDEHGQSLSQLDGPIIPEWAGEGDPGEGYYAGQPGTAFAKILEELWTEVSPSGAYWNPTRIVSDNRIPAFETAISEYEFAAPDSEAVEVEVTLLFRRAFIALIEQKGWQVPDILMAQQTIRVK